MRPVIKLFIKTLRCTAEDSERLEPKTTNRPKRLRVSRGRSRTAAESVCDLDVNQSLSQPIKYIPFAVHKASELTKLQAASYVRVRYT